MTWFALHPDLTPEHLGFLPHIFDPEDPRKGREQVEDRYQHGGGWLPQDQWVVNVAKGTAKYPGDEPLQAVAASYLPLTDERILLFPHDYVCLIQRDGSYEMARMN